MKKCNLSILPIVFTFLIMGCATATVNTYKKDEFNGPYKRIYLFFNISSGTEMFVNGFTKNIKERFAERGIDVEIYVTKSLGLETQVDAERIRNYKADAILIIRETRNTVSKDGASSGTFDLKLFEKKFDNLVWQGTMRAHGDYGISKAIDKATNSFILKLEDENIIPKVYTTAP